MNMKKIFAAMAATAISATSFAAMSLSANAADVVGVAGIRGQAGTYHYWADDNNSGNLTVKDAQIDGNAQYEATWELTGDGTGSIEFFMLEIKETESLGNAFTADTFPDLSLTVDEVYIDGEKFEFTQNDAAINLKYYETDTKRGSRAYFTDVWNGNETLGVPADQAITQSVKVVFTVGGLYNDGTSNVTPNEEPTDAPETDAPAATTAAGNNDNKGTTTTTKKANGGKTESSTKTGDAGVGIAVAAIAVAGAAAFVARKKD